MTIKICGLTSLDDALMADECGADLLGFVHIRRSRRFMALSEIERIVNQLPQPEKAVVLFDIRETAGLPDGPWSIVQLLGAEKEDDLPVISTTAYISVNRTTIDNFPGRPCIFDESEGSGTLATSLDAFQRPVLLAGGLNPSNVAQAIHDLRPAGVDVSSGVEQEPRRKDRSLVEAFIGEARSAFSLQQEQPYA